jgi:DNA-binding MarR family transcriptional regulator
MTETLRSAIEGQEGLDPEHLEVPPLSPVGWLGWAIFRIARYSEDALREADLTLRQYFALTLIAQGPLSPTEIAQRTNTSGPNSTAILRELLDLGLVKRHVSTADQRRVWVMITTDGRDALVRANAHIDSRAGEIAGFFAGKGAPTRALTNLAS